jgi:hypothetical protein
MQVSEKTETDKKAPEEFLRLYVFTLLSGDF